MTRTSSALLLTLALAATPAFAGNDISKVNGSITAQAGQNHGDLSTVNGSITVEDNATTGSVEAVNGSLKIGDGARTGGIETVNGGIRAGSKVQVDGDVETVNGPIFLDRGSRVREGVSTVNGAIGLVGTEVGGGIETVNGDITVGVDSHVRGGLKVEKPKGNFNIERKRPPRIVVGPNATIDGPLVFEREVVLHVHRTAKIGPVTGATARPFDTPTAPAD